MILVVGATGQLGTRVVRKLLEQGKQVRALVRPRSESGHLARAGAQLAPGDLRDAASLEAACAGVEAVIATATAISPGRDGGDIRSVDDEGYVRLIEACRRAAVGQVILASVPSSPMADRVPLNRAKRQTGERLRASGLPYTIFELGMFADIWPALLGSSIPQRGAEAKTLERHFWFLRIFRGATGEMIEKKGKASVPGSPDTRVSFIAIDDVATIMANSVGHPEAMNRVFQIGGPEVITWKETLDLFSRKLGRPIAATYTPAAVFRGMQIALRPVSSSASSLMGLNWVTASGELPIPDPDESRRNAAIFGVPLTPFEAFLEEKLAQPAEA